MNTLQDWTDDTRIDDIAWEYAEPGYTTDKDIILMADWNRFDREEISAIEEIAEIEWSDEWATCGDCGRLVRTNPDSYHWQAAYVIVHECELLCIDCMDPAEYYVSIENDPRIAITCPIAGKYPPEEYGYILLEAGLESGLHPHQTADPNSILARLQQQGGYNRVLFVMTEQSQFGVEFSVYYHGGEVEDEDM